MRIKFKIIVCISILLITGLIISIIFSSEQSTTEIFSENFESGKITAKCSGNCPSISQKFVNHGQYSMMVHLDRKNSKVNYRTEIQEKSKATYGDEFWYEFSIYLPDSYVPDNIWEIVAQWHAVPDFHLGEDWRNPVLSLHTTNGAWKVLSFWDSKENTFESGKREYSGSKAWPLGNYEVNQWVTWKFHVIWSHLNDGLIEVWKNGKQVITQQGPNCFNDNIGPYFKIGMYKGWKKNPKPSDINQRLLYIDDITITKR
jgi:hypothetical protein